MFCIFMDIKHHISHLKKYIAYFKRHRNIIFLGFKENINPTSSYEPLVINDYTH